MMRYFERLVRQIQRIGKNVPEWFQQIEAPAHGGKRFHKMLYWETWPWGMGPSVTEY